MISRRSTRSALVSAVSVLLLAVALPIMGAQIDRFGPGAALQYVGMLGVVLAVIFGAMYAYFAARGGYRAVKLPAGL